MLMAALGDIHGNLPALEAVLAEIDDAGILTILNTGDCVVGGASPSEVVDVIRARQIPTVQGLMDRRAAGFLRKRATLRAKHPADFEAIAWTYERLRSDNIEFLSGLPKTVSLTIEGLAMVLCHGAPSGPGDVLRETDALERFRRQRERANARIVVCGQTHEAFARWVDDTLFVNPGAVGVSGEEDARASYALIDTEESPWRASFRRVAYQ